MQYIVQKIIFPVAVTAIEKNENIMNLNALLNEKSLQIGLNEPEVTQFDSGAVIFDFGRELAGGIRILTYTAEKGAKVKITLGESMSEAMSRLFEKGSCNDHAVRDGVFDLTGLSDMTFFGSGFRFAKLEFFGRVTVKAVVASCREYENPDALYIYNGGDELTKRIFETAKRTVDLCMTSGYLWDGVKRDRLVWIGDMHPEMLAVTTLYGRSEIVERSLDFVKDQTPLPLWMNGMPSYSVWWIIILADYYAATGCNDFVVHQLDYLTALLNQIDKYINNDGELAFPSYFVDWPTHGEIDEKSGVRALNIIAQNRAKALLAAFHKDCDICDKILAKLRKKEMTVKKAKQVAALKFFANGSLEQEDIALLLEGGARGISTFMSYYILKAVAETAGRDTAEQMMKDYYGEMLRMGATTFWEDFDVEWAVNTAPIDRLPLNGEKDIHGDFGKFCYVGFRHSLCHGWSSGVIRFIKEYL